MQYFPPLGPTHSFAPEHGHDGALLDPFGLLVVEAVDDGDVVVALETAADTAGHKAAAKASAMRYLKFGFPMVTRPVDTREAHP